MWLVRCREFFFAPRETAQQAQLQQWNETCDSQSTGLDLNVANQVPQRGELSVNARCPGRNLRVTAAQCGVSTIT